jgi:hypothetical protein
MELASCQPSDTCNFVVPPRFFENMWTYFYVWTPAIDDYTPALYSKASTLNKETEGSL